MYDNEEVGTLGINLILLVNVICSYSEASYPNVDHASFQLVMDAVHFSRHIHQLTQILNLLPYFLRSDLIIT